MTYTICHSVGCPKRATFAQRGLPKCIAHVIKPPDMLTDEGRDWWASKPLSI